MLNWLVLSWALSAGMVPEYGVGVTKGINEVSYAAPDNSFFTDLSLKATLWKYVELAAGVKTYEYPDTAVQFTFDPYEAVYIAKAALVFDNFEVGLRHECDHGIESGTEIRPWVAEYKTEIYVTIKGSTSF
jgi:hypothetical protein